MNKKLLLSLSGILFVLIAIPATIFGVRQIQELRKQASPQYEKTATLTLSASPTTINANEVFTVTIMFDPKNLPISMLQMSMVYSDNLEFQGTQVTGAVSELNYSPNRVLTGTRIVQVAARTISENPYTAASAVSFGTMQFKALSAGTGTIGFQPTVTAVFGKGSNENLLATANDLSIAIGGTTGSPSPSPSVSPTPSPSGSPSPSPSGSPSPSPSGSPTPSPSGSPRASASPSPSGSPGTGGLTGSPTPTPSSLKLTSITSGQTVTNPRPVISGTASPGAKITITVESQVLTATVYADSSGKWSWTPTQDLALGTHTATIVATDSQGKTTTTSASFTYATASELPSTGIIEPTALFSLVGIGLIILGLVKLLPFLP